MRRRRSRRRGFCGIFLTLFFFAEDSLDGGPDGGPNFAEILNKALPDSDHSSDSQSDRSSNSGEVSWKSLQNLL